MLVLKHMVTEESAEALFAPCCLRIIPSGMGQELFFFVLFFRNMSGEKKVLLQSNSEC